MLCELIVILLTDTAMCKPQAAKNFILIVE